MSVGRLVNNWCEALRWRRYTQIHFFFRKQRESIHGKLAGYTWTACANFDWCLPNVASDNYTALKMSFNIYIYCLLNSIFYGLKCLWSVLISYFLPLNEFYGDITKIKECANVLKPASQMFALNLGSKLMKFMENGLRQSWFLSAACYKRWP